MADVTTKPFASPSNAASPPVSTIDDSIDPLASLHKMSMTAGLGSQDYVAINNLAIVALILGFAGALALIKPLFLLIPAGGLLCAIIAWFQIINSNGTQSGKVILLFATLLCLGIGGFVTARTIGGEIEAREDQQKIGALISEFGQDIANHRYDRAYALCSDEFRQRVSQSKFMDTFAAQERFSTVGPIKSIAWNQADDWFGTEANGTRIAVAMTLFTFAHSAEPSRQSVSFSKAPTESGGQWQVNDIPNLFPKPRRAAMPGAMPQPGEAAPEGPAMP